MSLKVAVKAWVQKCYAGPHLLAGPRYSSLQPTEQSQLKTRLCSANLTTQFVFRTVTSIGCNFFGWMCPTHLSENLTMEAASFGP